MSEHTQDWTPEPWTDDVPLAGPNRPANDGSVEYLIGYLLTVRKRFGNTCVTADLQWGASALWVAHREREELVRVKAERAVEDQPDRITAEYRLAALCKLADQENAK